MANSGPFDTYVAPGVYTQTLRNANAANLVAGIRIPVLIGVGQQDLDQVDLELVRGSSSMIDEEIVSEDVSERFVVDETNPLVPVLGAATGLITKFQVRNAPIVDGQGLGRVTNNAATVGVTVNGLPVAVGAVRGQQGYVILQVPPQVGDDVRCTYHFHRGDTAFTDTVSNQVTAETATITTPGVGPFTIIAGTTDTLSLIVDGTAVSMTFPAGTYSAATLKSLVDAQAVSGLSVAVTVDNQARDHLAFTSAKTLQIGAGSANGALGFAPGTTTSRNRAFRVFQRPIVDGTGGGTTTTDPTKVQVIVNGTQVLAQTVDGTNGLVTLAEAPAAGSVVTITYFANTWQDTFDYLPNVMITDVQRAGFAAGRTDYIEGQDFVVTNPSPTTSIIHWGSSYAVASATRSPGASPFNEVQILPALVDDKLYRVACERVVDTTVVPARVSLNQFLLPEVPTTGNGRDTPLGSDVFHALTNNRIGLDTNRPDLVQVYAGHDVKDAMSRSALTVKEVDAATRTVTLKESVPPDQTLFATFWFSRLHDDTFIFTNKVAGASGVGQFEVFSSETNTKLFQTRFGAKTSLPETVQWPRGVETIPDAYHVGDGVPVNETVTVTFSSGAAKNAIFTTTGAGPYNFFPSASNTWRSVVNGTTYTTNLNTAVRGYLVSNRVVLSGGNITISAGVNDTLALTIDGTDVDVTLTAGSRTPAQIVTDINTAIDANATFLGTAPNTLASTVAVGAVSDAVFIIRSFSTPAALPGGFDHASAVSLRQGTAEATLGFDTFQSAVGTPTATNKFATLLGTKVGPFNIQTGVNDVFNVQVDGTVYTVTLPTGSSVAASAVVAAIVAVPGLSGVAVVGTLANVNKVRLVSPTRNELSSLVILDGNANDTLGFVEGDSALATPVSVQEVVNELMATASFTTTGIAYMSVIDNAEYLTIESRTTGPSASSVAFASGATSAFITETGTQIVPGTSGDVGEAASDIFTVTSSHGSGSAGTGVPGQTYTDVRTGLRFTILPASVGSYSAAGSFTMFVSSTFIVHPARPWLSIGGLEVTVTDTVNVGVDDTATLKTYDPHGVEPAIGDFYFITYKYQKTDFSTRLFQTMKAIEANFGPVSAENRVSLAASLAIMNGAVLVGIKQVLKVVNTNQASDQAFFDAISELAIPLQGNIKPDIIVPLATSTPIYSFLMQHCAVQSNFRNQGERMGFIGFASGTSPTSAQTIAKNLASNRIVAVYPDTAELTFTNALNEPFSAAVDGTFLAAALAGAVVSPSVDVATPYTRRRLQGITRLLRTMDPITASQTAVAGVTVIESLDTLVRIRHGLTTDMSDELTRLPTVTQIDDHVHQQSRTVLDAFVGTKFIASRTGEIEVSLTALFRSMVQAQIVGAFTGISAEPDPDSATTIRAEAYYAPIFPLLFIVMTFNIRSRL